MAEKQIQTQDCIDHGDRGEHNKQNLHRIRRIKGQLESLEHMIECDEGSCEERVVRARTIEKGMTSLINHLVTCYIDNTLKYRMQDEPDEASEEIAHLLKLLNK
jgi:DNA-binding FrmR family transcriptional regulator